jgi:HTH-type transcriptional regulator/antitoxin HigA
MSTLETSAPSVSPAYAKLLAKVPPKIIRTEKENDSYTAALYALEHRRGALSSAEKDLAELLTLLIEDFEQKHYQLPKATPLEAIAFLMDQHGLKQKDLLEVFGTPSIVSEVMRGKRRLNRDHIARLSQRFHVSPELFF